MKRFVTITINIIAAITAVVSLSILQMKYSENNYNNITQVTSYEETVDFKNILEDKINDIFLYIQLKNCFETNNKLNYGITIAETIDKDNGLKQWTIRDCLDAAIAHGLYIDRDFTVNVLEDSNAMPFSNNTLYNFTFKAYPSSIRVGSSTEEDFLTEFMYCLASYYKCQFTLSNENSNLKYLISFYDNHNTRTFQYFNTNMTSKEILDTNSFIYMSSVDNIISSSFNTVGSSILKNAKLSNPIMDNEFVMYCYIDPTYKEPDLFNTSYATFISNKRTYAILTTITTYAIICFLISLILTLLFMLSTTKRVDESQKMFYYIPTELYIVIYILSLSILFLIITKYFDSNKYINYNMIPIKVNYYLLALYTTTILLFTILTTKFENDTLVPLSIKMLNENSSLDNPSINANTLIFVVFIPMLMMIFISIYLFYLFSMTNLISTLLAGIVLLVATIGFTVYILLLHNSFKKAILVQKKANDMRTSLIANVSHDIKTPLTSIITYTDLITDELNHFTKSSKKELEKYSEIIINKSHRLNDLINNLIFDSKVSSGNVELNMVTIDLNAFLEQIIAEFADKLNEKELKVLYNNSATNVNILADSSQLYRVFQNLFTNIYKYALENSRVYVDLDSIKSKTIITIKNIQKEKLEVNPDTLKDRFVRGNKSRTTEGFGLGLSISENLIKSMGGKLDIISVRDVFTAKITFVAYEG